jgi:1-acyl-sn-glycerol-3-phosphate acyltransferase
LIRSARPRVVIRPEAVEALERFEASLSRGVGRRAASRQSISAAVVAALLCGVARLFCRARRGSSWAAERPRIYFANHTSHLDFLAIWASLPPQVRVRSRPIAGQDYWNRDAIRRYLARRVFRALLVNRRTDETGVDRDVVVSAARRSVERVARALSVGDSLIIFPEGTRGSGNTIGPFKSGLYHLSRMRPDVELVPVLLEDLDRILPKGEIIPLPLSGVVTFGEPMCLQSDESKDAFLARARAALVRMSRPCTSLSTEISRASSPA